MYGASMTEDRALLDRARGGDAKAFDELARPHRRALEAHCYRMLGSLADADDAVQDTLLRAWKGLGGWEERSQLRTWLHRIATNVCLDVAARRKSRVLPNDAGPPSAIGAVPRPSGEDDPPWLEPAPPALWEGSTPTPEALIGSRESVRIAFVCALQRLPASQRAVLLLRDVLGWSAQEVGDLLDMTVPAVNSALQRARSTLESRPVKEPRDDETMRALVLRYVAAWESGADVLATLLREDAVLTMPPMPGWYEGAESIRAFASWLLGVLGELRWVPVMAAGVPAVAVYERKPGAKVFTASGIHVVRFDGDRIAEIHAFLQPHIFPRFGLPAESS
jgi:RNA polymerase sigma-70 factor (ECF subfamily)